MKQRRLICILSILMCVVMISSLPAHAAEARASDRINISSVTLGKKSNGDFNIYFSVQATGKMDVIGASSVKIQRNTTTGWATEYTFTPSNSPNIQAESKSMHSATLTYSPLFTGKEYRAVVIIYVKDASGSSTQQLISRIVTA